MPSPVKTFRRAVRGSREPERAAVSEDEVTEGLPLSHEAGMNVTFKPLAMFSLEKYIISDIF
jgi:hypothetical protein